VASEKVNNTTKLHNHEWTYSSCVAPGVVLSKFGNQQAKNWARAPFRITLKISRSQARIVSSAKTEKKTKRLWKKKKQHEEKYMKTTAERLRRRSSKKTDHGAREKSRKILYEAASKQ